MTKMGADVAGQNRWFTVQLHNHTDRTIKIIGGTVNCACMATDDLPVTIPPGGFAPVTVWGRFKGTPGMFQQEFQFYYADGEEHRRVIARFEGRIIEAANLESEKTP